MRYAGCLGVIKLDTAGTSPATVLVGELTEFSYEETHRVDSYQKMGNCTEQTSLGPLQISGEFTANFDHEDAGQILLLDEFASENEVSAFFAPLGEASGLPLWEGDILVTGIRGPSAPADQYWTIVASYRANERLARSIQAP